MELFQTILECKEENVNSIIEIAIKQADTNAKKVEKLGFL